jgi:hypothetical protein
MRKIITSLTAAILLLFSISASADVVQVWRCQLVDGKTDDDLMALSKSWLDAAKQINDNARVSVSFPIAADAKEGSFLFAFFLPDFTAWGTFNDAYPDSAVAQVDEGWNEIAPCKISGLWSTEDIE